MGNDHRDGVTVFRFEVLNHHVDVRDIRIEVTMGILAGRFVATSTVPGSFQMSMGSERAV